MAPCLREFFLSCFGFLGTTVWLTYIFGETVVIIFDPHDMSPFPFYCELLHTLFFTMMIHKDQGLGDPQFSCKLYFGIEWYFSKLEIINEKVSFYFEVLSNYDLLF